MRRTCGRRCSPNSALRLAHYPDLGVEPVEGGLIVNIGDLMQRWTNDRWRSTMHRVVSNGRCRRLSIPFFHNANWDTRIESIVTGDALARYPPTTAGRHLMEKFRSTVM